MIDGHLRLIKHIEVECPIDIVSPPSYHMVVIKCQRSEIQCDGTVWTFSIGELVVLREAKGPVRCPKERFEALAEGLVPTLKTLQNCTKPGRVLEWSVLQEAHSTILQLGSEQLSDGEG